MFHVRCACTVDDRDPWPGIWDACTRHVELGQRFYNPADGRLTQTDAITQLNNPTNGNPYTYAAANPPNYVDPAGRDGTMCAMGIIRLGASMYWM